METSNNKSINLEKWLKSKGTLHEKIANLVKVKT